MNADHYKTISKPSEGLFKDKGSKFLSYAFPVYSEDEIKDLIQQLKKEHHSARHHCYAWMLGANKQQFRANDDGEPSSTGGKPILGQIQSFDLTNVLIVVVRYFGGTLLGVSGLINAYRTAAADALSNATIVEKIVEDIVLIDFDYETMNDVMKILKDENLEQLESKYDLRCQIKTGIRISETERIVEKVNKIEGTNVRIINS